MGYCCLFTFCFSLKVPQYDYEIANEDNKKKKKNVTITGNSYNAPGFEHSCPRILWVRLAGSYGVFYYIRTRKL